MNNIIRSFDSFSVFSVSGDFNLFDSSGEHNGQKIIKLAKEKIIEDISLPKSGDALVVICFNGSELKVRCRYVFFDVETVKERIQWSKEKLSQIRDEKQDDFEDESDEILKYIEYLEGLIPKNMLI